MFLCFFRKGFLQFFENRKKFTDIDKYMQVWFDQGHWLGKVDIVM